MKKNDKIMVTLFVMLVLCSVFARFNAYAAVDITGEFTDANFLAEVYEVTGKTAPALIYDTDVSGITEFYVPSKNIASLAGIEHFISLEKFSCVDNELTELDLSNNTELIYLTCGNNQLEELDVSNNTKLIQLFCGRNPLTSLNVSGCTELKEINCEWSSLTVLDVSGCTALEKLICSQNQLTTLNIGSLSNLKNLYCPYNQLITLDVSSCLALEFLDCAINYMASPSALIGCTLTGSQLIFDPQRTVVITDGADGSWRRGTASGMTITSNGDFAEFTGVQVDGTLIGSDKYTAVSGSTIVTLKPAYLSTLSTGKHTIDILFTNGSASTEFTITSSPAVITTASTTTTTTATVVPSEPKQFITIYGKSGVTLRSTPSITGADWGKVALNTELLLLTQTTDYNGNVWYMVKVPDGRSGWLYGLDVSFFPIAKPDYITIWAKSTVILRSTASASSKNWGAVAKGTSLILCTQTVDANGNVWYMVKTPDGRSGWMIGTAVTFFPM